MDTLQPEDQSITEDFLMSLADSMAAAAASFSAHGYDEFVKARDLFKSTNHRLFEMISKSFD